jgi:hypothetical protein
VPAKPKVDKPRAVKVKKSGKRVVVRFYIAQYQGHNPFKQLRKGQSWGASESNWYVMDSESGTIAVGTVRDGYPKQDDARAVARKYRDEYGAYAEVDF